MATESVDELDKILLAVRDWGEGLAKQEFAGLSPAEAKVKLDAYYTQLAERECARKVLEGQADVLGENKTLSLSADESDDYKRGFESAIEQWNKYEDRRIAELRAAIQEVGGGK